MTEMRPASVEEGRPSGFTIRENQYYDSVFLMGVNSRLAKAPGVRQTAVLMGSEKNKVLLADLGIHGAAVDAAGANDLIIAVVADDESAVRVALDGADDALVAVQASTTTSQVHTLEDGQRLLPGANLAVLTIPGDYVFEEASKALEAGLHVFIFSSNVPVEQERALKEQARPRGLLVMGPDCGTSIVGGVGIGFANKVRRGPIGVIGPSGTGLQEFTCQIHHAGGGISHGIGTGGHDLSDDIGGATTLAALEALERDPATDVIAIVAKPGGERTLEVLASRLAACRKPVVACMLGMADRTSSPGLEWVSTIDDAVAAAMAQTPGPSRSMSPLTTTDPGPSLPDDIPQTPRQRYLRGLFAGGTLCYQSQQILRGAGLTVFSNAPLSADGQLQDAAKSVGHTVIDMGDDEHTRGRLHPMIDGTLRAQRIITESLDPEVSILLLDFILGTNVAEDPVGDIVGAIVESRSQRPIDAGGLTVVASICGTEEDPQDSSRQVEALIDAGVHVFWSNVRATEYCLARLGESR